MTNQFKVCTRCVQRHCRLSPKLEKTTTGPRWMCKKFRRHQEGFKMEEVYHEKEKQL